MIGKHWKVASLLMLLVTAEVLAKKDKGNKNNKNKNNKNNTGNNGNNGNTGNTGNQGNCAHDCCIVVNLWKHFGKSTSVDPNSSTACCSMDGVHCSGTSVIKLFWFSQGLTGTIPSSIGNLSSLKRLQLYSNQLSGPIPSSVGNLSNLQYLYLYENQLSGSIPSSIGNLRKLEYLGLKNNQLTGTIPSSIGNLSNLLRIWLHENQLSGSIPSSIGNLSKLEILALRDNQLSGPIPSSIGNLKKLQNLRLQRNELSGTIPSTIGNLSNLEVIYLGKNSDLSGTLRTRARIISTGGTQIIVCGSAASNAPGSFYRNENPNCLSVSSSTLRKRVTIPSYHHVYGGKKYTFTCTINDGSNPYQDCINHMAFACYRFGSSECKSVVNARFAKFNRHWKGMLNSCARWKTKNTSGCEASLADLRKNAWYHVPGEGNVRPDIIFTNSLRDQLWSKVK